MTTTSGEVRGAATENGMLAFKGIPYAAPPVGDLRFRPPQPVEPWTDVRDALELPPSCPQPSTRPPGWAQERTLSEDCLYLNVWTPALDGTRPVMVWIHGGGYAIGSGSWPLYDGANLSKRGDVAVITLNHRLGPLGYLHLGELLGDGFESSGNNGQLDLVAALEWVRDNAASFGGDPGNVTVFGESGGGAKISMLLAMPSARGLFHRAAIQSGPGTRVMKPSTATRFARALIESLELGDDLEALWKVPADQLVAAGAAAGRMAFGPVLDGKVLPAHPAEALAAGTAIDVPVLIGCNRDETIVRGDLDDEGARARLAAAGEEHVDEIMAVYAELFPDAPQSQRVGWAMTDAGMRAGSIRLAEAKVAGTASPVFMYFFTYDLAGFAGHGYEIAFVFDNLGTETKASSSRQVLADVMSEAWLAFARDGDPNHASMAKWPAYSLPERPTMVFGRDGAVVVDDPSAQARELWARLPPMRRGAIPLVG